MKLTIRELREILFNIENQDMTICELRLKLFDVDEQDKENESMYELFQLIKQEVVND